MIDAPSATLRGAIAGLLFWPRTHPRIRWAFLFAVLAQKANNAGAVPLSKWLHDMALRIKPENCTW